MSNRDGKQNKWSRQRGRHSTLWGKGQGEEDYDTETIRHKAEKELQFLESTNILDIEAAKDAERADEEFDLQSDALDASHQDFFPTLTMKVIHKFRIPASFRGPLDLAMTAGARILHVAMQCDVLTLWAEVDDGKTVITETRRIRTYGTGTPFQPLDHAFLGTAITDDGMFVWHVYEII